jgi:hypothetical protein
MATETHKGHQCPKDKGGCGSFNTRKNGSGRSVCIACGTSFKNVYKANPRPNTGLEGICVNCGHEGKMDKRGFHNDQQLVGCKQCGKRQPYGATVRASDIADETNIFVVTWAQNATRAHKGFLAAVAQYCTARKAKLIVIPGRYRNPTSRNEKQDDDWWSPDVAAFLLDKRIQLADGLQLLADIKIQPTAACPLSGLDTMTGTDCGIVGHPKIALESIPTRGHELPKLLWSTGSCTIPNYSESKAGAKGKFHHVIGALVVETDMSGKFHVRNINAEHSGAFIDLDKRYTPLGVEQAKPAAAIVLGDVHAERVDEKVAAVTLGTGGIIDTLKPARIVLHDVLDFGSASHHNSMFERFLRRVLGKDDVEKELLLTCAWIDTCYRPYAETIIVSSNHHNHLRKWLEKADYREDMQNAEVYASVLAEMLTIIKKTHSIPDPFELIAKRLLEHKAKFLSPKESYTAAGIEFGYHGDLGPNGSRGSAKSLDKIGSKTVIGHSHTPCINGGCYQTGTSSQLDMGYNAGPSSWMHSHVVVYANGKRTHIHIVDGSWRRIERRHKPREKVST